MEKLYFSIFFVCTLFLGAQTTINYSQSADNYNSIFTNNGGAFDNGEDEFGMWANGDEEPKQSAAWKNFTEDGTTTGIPSVMAIGDSFTITVAATRAYGVIGVALLSSPTATASWDDRINNYAVQVNLDGNTGAFDKPWEVVSNAGTVNTSSIFGATNEGGYNDFKLTFTLDTASTMTVSINDTESFNVTLNNEDITGYAIYLENDWNGAANADVYWKPTTEYTYAMSLNTNDYLQRAENYNSVFTINGGNFNNGEDEFGMWANGDEDPKQSVAWKTFTEDATTTGTPSTMAMGDSFTITLSATRAYGVIGVALLSSPTATASWEDRINNYAVQVNLDGNTGVFDKPWEVVSNAGTVNASSIFGATDYNDFKFTFTLDTASTMTVSINDTESFSVTLNNEGITGYAIYLENDWNGAANTDVYWKPTTEYTYAMTLNTADKVDFDKVLSIYPNPASHYFSINQDVETINIYSLNGKLVKSFKGALTKGKAFNISNLSKSLYVIKAAKNSGEIIASKLIKY